jgi:uncharacterized membrane protein YidH (DUF202 family)
VSFPPATNKEKLNMLPQKADHSIGTRDHLAAERVLMGWIDAS